MGWVSPQDLMIVEVSLLQDLMIGRGKSTGFNDCRVSPQDLMIGRGKSTEFSDC